MTDVIATTAIETIDAIDLTATEIATISVLTAIAMIGAIDLTATAIVTISVLIEIAIIDTINLTGLTARTGRMASGHPVVTTVMIKARP